MKKTYEKPQMKAVKILTEQFMNVSFGLETTNILEEEEQYD